MSQWEILRLFTPRRVDVQRGTDFFLRRSLFPTPSVILEMRLRTH